MIDGPFLELGIWGCAGDGWLNIEMHKVRGFNRGDILLRAWYMG